MPQWPGSAASVAGPDRAGAQGDGVQRAGHDKLQPRNSRIGRRDLSLALTGSIDVHPFPVWRRVDRGRRQPARRPVRIVASRRYSGLHANPTPSPPFRSRAHSPSTPWPSADWSPSFPAASSSNWPRSPARARTTGAGGSRPHRAAVVLHRQRRLARPGPADGLRGCCPRARCGCGWPSPTSMRW